MRSAAQAYQTIAKQTVSPRDLEADLLLKAASRLQAVKDGWEGAEDKSTLDEALLYNRKLWTIFLTSATSGDNPLPTDVRQNVANLGVFVMTQTLTVQADPKPERLVTLININRELAAGLRSGK
jgi:flagellar protein FlaF